MSLRKAIDEKCKDCIYDKGAPGTWRQQVEACTITSCSLHEYRPVMLRNTAKSGQSQTDGLGRGLGTGIRRLVSNLAKSAGKTDKETIPDMEPA